MVREEHAQSDRMRGTPPPVDHWVPYAQQFVADPRRADDPLVAALRQLVQPHHVLMDVGAGAGRMALPLALSCRHVVAVEPSASMAATLVQQAASEVIKNISVVQSTWQDAEVERVDIIICCHVVYTVPDIELFVRKLNDHADKIIVVLYDAPPQSQIHAVWKQVHDEDRLFLPSLPELKEVLNELGIVANFEQLPARPSRGYSSFEEAEEQLTGRLFLQPNSPKIENLRRLLPQLLEDVDGEFQVRGSRTLTPYLVSWSPAS